MAFLYGEKQFDEFRGWMGALGTSLGTALGVKLARGDGLVLCIIGDGAWHYNPVPAALGFAQKYQHPLFIVLCNNRQYVSQTWNVLRYFPEGEAVKTHNFVGNQIQPAPNYIFLFGDIPHHLFGIGVCVGSNMMLHSPSKMNRKVDLMEKTQKSEGTLSDSISE